jgi:asparagine N-glycosylation enzyme membrane subunit Stt3
MEIAWTVVAVIVPLLVGVAMNLIGMTPAHFRAAKVCFITAAVLLGGMSIVWDSLTPKPFWFRLAVGISVGAIIGVGLPESIRWIAARKRAVSPVAPATEQKGQSDKPPTLVDLFKSDFPNTLKFTDPSCEIQWKNGDRLVFQCQGYMDFPGKS